MCKILDSPMKKIILLRLCINLVKITSYGSQLTKVLHTTSLRGTVAQYSWQTNNHQIFTKWNSFLAKKRCIGTTTMDSEWSYQW